MSLFRTLPLLFCLASAAIAPPVFARPNDEIARLAWDDRPRDQDRAFRGQQQGQSMPLPMIEQRIIPYMGGAEYLGPEMRGGNVRLKFIDRRQGKVKWVDVNPKTGKVVGKSGD